MKVTQDTDYFTASRVPIILNKAHPKAKTKNELLQEIISKRAGTWVEEPQSDYSKYTDDFEMMLRGILLRTFPQLRCDPKAKLRAHVCADLLLGASIDDMFSVEKGEELIFTSPDGESCTFAGGKFLVEYKVTSVMEDGLPLWRGPLQLQAQMMACGVDFGVIVRFNIRTWKIDYFPMFAHEKTQNLIRGAVDDFWKRVLAKKYYEPEDTDYEIVHPKVDHETIDLSSSNEVGVACQLWEEGNNQIKDGGLRKKEAEVTIKKSMGNHEFAKFGTKVIKWGERFHQAAPEKTIPAKPSYSSRSKTISIKEV